MFALRSFDLTPRHHLLAFGLLLGASSVVAQVPSTDIFVIPVDGDRLGRPQRLTDRDGYDNQPMFLPGGKRLVYSSMGESGTDIYVHDLAAGSREVLVATPQSEYSPRPIPGRQAISVVRDYGEMKQQLWAFPLDGGEPELLLPDVNPVGYHAWIDERQLILFVLGEPMTLQLARVGPGEGKMLASSPGRALSRIPGSAEMSFVDKSGDAWWLTAIDPANGNRRQLMPTLEQVEDYVWAPGGIVWAGKGSRLYRRSPRDDEWQQVADLERHEIRGITRLAFSPDGKQLALVAQH